MEGLTLKEAIRLQKKFGKNEIEQAKKVGLFSRIFHTLTEPTILLLIIAAFLYLVLGESSDGVIMFASVIVIVVIDVVQEWRTDKTLRALKELSAPKVMVLRDGRKTEISSSDLVPGDIAFIHEGVKIPADGFVLESSGLSVDESSLTGESGPVWKAIENYCYQGTLVLQGTGTIKIDKIGSETEYGKIGKSLNQTKPRRTNLQREVDKIVRFCAIFALIMFILVTIISFFNMSDLEISDRLVQSLLSGLAIALAMIPEEFPVVLTVFLALGAWRLAKKNSVIRKLPKTEVLGAITTLCVDKTGTITKNEMKITDVFNKIDDSDLLRYMCLCSEEETYDPMEKAIFEYAKKEFGIDKKQVFAGEKLQDFPFDNNTKIVGRAWKNEKNNLVVCKGSPESILKLCKLSEKEQNNINEELKRLQEKGLRVIACAYNSNVKNLSSIKKLSKMEFKFAGMIGLIDPPREYIKKYIEKCYSAGVKTIMITGDNGVTAAAIAEKIGIQNTENIITGDMLEKMSDKDLAEAVRTVSIFSRVVPEHKLRIIKALQADGEVVAMTGDGVNDAPALKQADIGIAMGKRGSEVAREAADLILLDDDFKTIVETIEDGRRIYDNIRKAIEYILIIHVPIALSALVAPLLGIDASLLFLLPPQIVLFELIIDPTCSIILERRPAEYGIMARPPRNIGASILNWKHLALSLAQGLIIFAVAFGSYLAFLPLGAELARTVGLMIILLSSLFLVFVYSSEYDFTYQSFLTLIRDKVVVFVNVALIIFVLIIVYSPLNQVFKLAPLSVRDLLYVLAVAFVGVFWFEFVKIARKIFKK